MPVTIFLDGGIKKALFSWKTPGCCFPLCFGLLYFLIPGFGDPRITCTHLIRTDLLKVGAAGNLFVDVTLQPVTVLGSHVPHKQDRLYPFFLCFIYFLFLFFKNHINFSDDETIWGLVFCSKSCIFLVVSFKVPYLWDGMEKTQLRYIFGFCFYGIPHAV